jgi:DeoR family ulaG and ulaABCDEF operon transcriptional repressor
VLEQQRKDAILRLLSLHRVASIHDVVDATGASESTIRRDFVELERDGKLVRVRGGVRLAPGAEPVSGSHPESTFERRSAINREKKRRIAQKACTLLRDGETIFVDGGTTTSHMVEFLSGFSLRIVTNSFAIASHLVRHSACTVILPEGTVDPDSQLILNNLTADPFANYAASKAFMGTEGITETALTNDEKLVIQAERAMIEHAQELIILADDSKFGKIGHLTLCPVEKAARIITTSDADPRLVAILREKGIEVIKA